MSPEKENTTPPKNDSIKATVRNGRRKAKKTVSRTYQDEDGYLGKVLGFAID